MGAHLGNDTLTPVSFYLEKPLIQNNSSDLYQLLIIVIADSSSPKEVCRYIYIYCFQEIMGEG